MFWGWSVVSGALILHLDPEYDSIAPAMMYFLGWLMGLIYCSFWVIIRLVTESYTRSSSTKQSPEYISRVSVAEATLSSSKQLLFYPVLGLIMWGALSVLCLLFPFIDRARYNETDCSFFLYYLFGCGPILLLSVTMFFINLRELLKKTQGVTQSASLASEIHESVRDPSKLATLSIILGCLAVVFGPFSSIPGILIGYKARCRLRQEGNLWGERLAYVGLIISWVATVLWILSLVVGLSV